MHTKLDTLLTVPQAAKMLGVHVSWLYERTRTHAVPCYRFGTTIRFDRDTLRQWFKEQGGKYSRHKTKATA